MDLDTIGYFLFMESQERQDAEEQTQEQEDAEEESGL